MLGSLFLQISAENFHHVKEILDEVFGPENYLNVIPFVKTSGVTTRFLANRVDFLLWYAKSKAHAKYAPLFLDKSPESGTADNYRWLELADGSRRGMTAGERRGEARLPAGARVYKPDNITSQGNPVFPFVHLGKKYAKPWKTNPAGMQRLAENNRLHVAKNSLQYVRYLDDFPCIPVTQLWSDTQTGNFTDDKLYAVQTGTKTIERCIHMSTEPGDLVIDPTCGSGTTAYAAERWGRRWITCDVSRVPLALARQRLLTATFSWYLLKDDKRGPVAGFDYQPLASTKNPSSIGPGIVPHLMLENITNNEQPKPEVIVDRPEQATEITRVTGPFTFEATIPTPVDFDGDGQEDSGASAVDRGSFTDRMLEVLRRSPLLRLNGNRTVKLANIRSPAKTLSLSAEAIVVNGTDKPVALVFGPENGAISEQLVFHAAREANAKNYTHLYVVGFAIQPNARKTVDECEATFGIAATYVQATPDLLMGDLLKNMRSSQIFSVCGLPEVKLRKAKGAKGAAGEYEVELVGLDVFDPVTMENEHRAGNDVPAWFLDADYNDLCFHVSQAFFPRTSAWDNLKKAIKGDYDADVWDHLAGTVSAPFAAGEHGQIAVKVIDDRGNELVVVKKLSEVENGGKAKR